VGKGSTDWGFLECPLTGKLIGSPDRRVVADSTHPSSRSLDRPKPTPEQSFEPLHTVAQNRGNGHSPLTGRREHTRDPAATWVGDRLAARL
jgi:hypothetical protein